MNAGTPSPIRSVKSALIVNQELELRAKNAEASLAELKKSVDELKKEKTEQEKVMEEKVMEEIAKSRWTAGSICHFTAATMTAHL